MLGIRHLGRWKNPSLEEAVLLIANEACRYEIQKRNGGQPRRRMGAAYMKKGGGEFTDGAVAAEPGRGLAVRSFGGP